MFLFHHWFLPLFFGCFHFANFLYHDCFLSGTPFLCCCTVSATDLGEFFYSQAFFTFHSFPTFGTTCFYQGFPGSRQPEGLLLRFKTQTQPICLFGSYSDQQKVYFVRFCLCVKALRNIISIFSRFWAHYLITICVVKRMLHLLDNRSS